MSRISFLLVFIAFIEFVVAADSPRERISINDHWRFTKGDPTNINSQDLLDRKVFNGLCLVIIRGKAGQPGKIKLTATADGLQVGATAIKTARAGKTD